MRKKSRTNFRRMTSHPRLDVALTAKTKWTSTTLTAINATNVTALVASGLSRFVATGAPDAITENRGAAKKVNIYRPTA
jgi:hypothetical protein